MALWTHISAAIALALNWLVIWINHRPLTDPWNLEKSILTHTQGINGYADPITNRIFCPVTKVLRFTDSGPFAQVSSENSVTDHQDSVNIAFPENVVKHGTPYTSKVNAVHV